MLGECVHALFQSLRIVRTFGLEEAGIPANEASLSPEPHRTNPVSGPGVKKVDQNFVTGVGEDRREAVFPSTLK